MGDRLGTPGAVDFFRSVRLFSTKNVTRKLFDKSTEVYISQIHRLLNFFYKKPLFWLYPLPFSTMLSKIMEFLRARPESRKQTFVRTATECAQ